MAVPVSSLSDREQRFPARRAGIVSLVVFLILTGCASQRSVRQLRGDLSDLKGQVEELRKSQEMAARELARTVGELKELDGRLGRRDQEEKETMRQFARVESRLQEALEAIKRLRSAADDRDQQAPQPARPPLRSGRPAEPLREEFPERLYSAALGSFRARELGQAVLEFLDFIAKFPKHPLAGHAQYWIGEAYYVQRDYRQALTEFQKAVEQYGNVDKAPDALLRIGACYRALGDAGRARDVWQQLIQDHSGSEAARKARALLQARAISARRPR
jgi:tol-pal system protein YbgF